MSPLTLLVREKHWGQGRPAAVVAEPGQASKLPAILQSFCHDELARCLHSYLGGVNRIQRV